MNLKKRLATVLWLGLALAASAMAAPPSLAQGHVGGGVTSLFTGVAQEDGDASAAQAIRDAESQCGSAGAAHWALYQRLRDRSAPASPPKPDFSGDWLLNTKASDDPREKAKEAAQASRLARGGARELGSCLGAQLIPNVLGAKVYANSDKEIGRFPIEVTETASVSNLFAEFPTQFDVFHWHEDTFNIPAGTVHVARSTGCTNQ
ncbi:MAG: hypothetical protein Q8N54_06440 [Sulfurimicrobium sp.]|nr:hypothetical protein [Sulfurimicrobium sp.]